ncbi:MAG: XdhC family protein [Acidobacteria bacterium]|nr:XdhC family protein [Acidobacteriota bacterium]
MKELLEILKGLEEVRSKEENAALATVVRVQGSAYRREGAKLFVTEKGSTIGNISAGCLESDVLEFTRKVTESRRPLVRHYGLMGDDELIWGFGQGCNGIIDVLIEPLETVNADLGLVSKAVETNSTLAIATVVFEDKQRSAGGRPSYESLPAIGTKLTVFGDGTKKGTLGHKLLDQAVAKDATDLLKRGRSRTLFYDLDRLPHKGKDEEPGIGVFIDTFAPADTLLVFGAGADSVPLAQYGKEVGFQVKVVDHRPAYATAERFPMADEVLCSPAEEIPKKMAINDRTYAVILTHNFNVDSTILAWLLDGNAPYIGILGPKERYQMIADKLARDGREISPEQSKRIFAPIGVDLGAEGMEQIALSIMAEILAVKNQRNAAFLREREGPMHDE